MISRRVALLRGLAFGASASLLAFGLNALVSEVLYPSVLPLYFGAVVIAAWYGGPIAAATCAALSVPGIPFLGDPRYSFAHISGDDILRSALFALVSGMIILLDIYRRREMANAAQSQKALAGREAGLRLALDVGQMGSWEWNGATRLVTWGKTAARLHGLEGTSGALEDFLAHVHPEDREVLLSTVARPVKRRVDPDVTLEYRIQLPDGEVRWLEGSVRVLPGPRRAPTMLLGVVRDITDRKEAEIGLLDYADKLRDSNVIKDEFLGMVSHELRNPITAILAGTRILKRRHDTLPPETREELLDDVSHEAERLNLIVENLLALARDRFGAVDDPEPVSVNRTIDAALTRARKARASRDYIFSRNGETYANIVPIYLDLVLRNLIDNAHKYSPSGEPIEISARQEADFVVISVRDHGPGVSAEDREHLFDRFYRARRTVGISGAGMGLTVCQRLVQSQGGRIACDNAPGGGLQVEVRIPACAVDEEDLQLEALAGSHEPGQPLTL